MAQPELTGQGKGRAVQLFGSDGTKWIAALIDALGHFQVDVVASGLPTGAATQATLALALTALQVIDGFADAQNLLFGYNDVYSEQPTVGGTGGNVYANGSDVDPNEIWIVTHMAAYHSDPAARKQMLIAEVDGSDMVIHWSATMAQWATLDRQGMWVLKEGDRIRCRWDGLVGGATGYLFISGYKMKIA